MLPPEDVAPIAALLARGAPEREIQAAAHARPDAAQSASGRPASAERAGLLGRAAARRAAQVPRDRPGLPQTGSDVPRLLHVLLPLGPVRRRAGPQDGDRRHVTGDAYLRSHREVTSVLVHRRRPDDHGICRAAPLRRAAARPEPGAHRVDPDRHQVAGLLAAAVPDRPRRRRHAAVVRRGRRRRQDAGADGALLAPARARADAGVARDQPDPVRRARSSAPRRR